MDPPATPPPARLTYKSSRVTTGSLPHIDNKGGVVGRVRASRVRASAAVSQQQQQQQQSGRAAEGRAADLSSTPHAAKDSEHEDDEIEMELRTSSSTVVVGPRDHHHHHHNHHHHRVLLEPEMVSTPGVHVIPDEEDDAGNDSELDALFRVEEEEDAAKDQGASTLVRLACLERLPLSPRCSRDEACRSVEPLFTIIFYIS
jgi:hypothetical protein